VAGLAVLTASSASLAQSAPAGDADAGSAPPAQQEAPMVMLEGGVTAAREPPKPVEPERYRTQRGLAVFAALGLIDGLGAGVRVGTPRIGLDLSGGYLPILATYSQDTEHKPKYEVLSSFQANATAYFGLYRTGPRTDIGISAGYKYDTVLRHGVCAAFYMQYDVGEHWALHIFAGPAIFPKADDGIRDKAHWPAEGSVGSGLSWLQGGFGLSLAYFP
jgi:hypothetical protein